VRGPRREPGIAGLLDGLRQIAEGLQGFSEQGEKRLDIGGREGRMVFGYSIRTADGRAEAFGHVPEAAARQPIVDVIEEADAILVIAEMPGVAAEDVTARIEDGALLLETPGPAAWRKRVALPGPVVAAGMTLAARNGIVEIRLPRSAA